MLHFGPSFDKNRSIRADRLFFNEDGTIQKVVPTLRGVGVVPAAQQIQLDRYSALGPNGASVEFLDSTKPFNGWKTILTEKGAWIRFDNVDFGKRKLKSVKVRALSESGGPITLRIRKGKTLVESKVTVPKGADWQVVKADVRQAPSGIQDIELLLGDSGRVEIDWIQFE